jgi:hypothetical protein
MERDKKIKIATEVAKYLQTKVKNSLLSVINGKDITDKAVSAEIKKIKEEVENSFISDYEIAA